MIIAQAKNRIFRKAENFKHDTKRNINRSFQNAWTGNWGGVGLMTRVRIYSVSNGVKSTTIYTELQNATHVGVVSNWSIPLSAILAFKSGNTVSVRDKFIVEIDWWAQSNLGGSSGGAAGAQIRLSEIRIVKGVKTPALKTDALQIGSTAVAGGFVGTDVGFDDAALRIGGHLLPKKDDTYSIGENNAVYSGNIARWDNIFATNGTIQTSDRRDKTEISGSDLGLDFIKSLRPVSYKWLDSEGNAKRRTHYGLLAQEVSSSLSTYGKSTTDFAGITTGSSGYSYNPSGSDWEVYNPWGLRYHQFISPLIKSIQELSDEVQSLKQQISGSNG